MKTKHHWKMHMRKDGTPIDQGYGDGLCAGLIIEDQLTWDWSLVDCKKCEAFLPAKERGRRAAIRAKD